MFTDGLETTFEDEYLWENFIIRLSLYRTTVRTLTHIHVVKADADGIIPEFDKCFQSNGRNGLKAIRDVIEQIEGNAAGKGRGPATRSGELDPWRTVTRDRFERGRCAIQRSKAYAAAVTLRSQAKRVCALFIEWQQASKQPPAL